MGVPPPQLLKEIATALAAIESTDAAAAGPHWGAMHKLLLKAKADPSALMRVVATRDVAELKRVVARVRGDEVPSDGGGAGGVDGGAGEAHGHAGAGAGAASGAAEVDPSVMNDALRAFKKRVKLTQLDAESKLGVGPMSHGSDQRIQAMIPPREYPFEVWEALVRAGKLRREGQGFYSIVETGGNRHW